MRIARFAITAAAMAAAGVAGTASAQTVRGVTKTEIVVGMHTDLSGPAASYGVTSSNAMRLAFDEINAKGGIYGRKIRFIVEDNQYQVPRAVQAGNKLINRDHIFVMAGALGTPMNNAVFPEQEKNNVVNFAPLSSARSMFEPFNRLKFGTLSSYYSQSRAGIKYLVETHKRSKLCVLYQDTDFGKEILDAAKDQAAAMKMTIVETATNSPIATDFTAQITKLRSAGCDLVAMGAIVRDAILPYATARKMGWTDVDFVSQAASFDQIVAGAKGDVTEGLYVGAGTVMPYRDTADATVGAWWDSYKARFGSDPNIGAVYGQGIAAMLAVAFEKAGKNLTPDSFIKGLESIEGYRDIFGGPVVSFGPKKHHGSDAVILFQVQKGRFHQVAGPFTHDS